MSIVFQKVFQKDFAKYTAKIQPATEERVSLFISDRHNPLLNFHALRGDFADCFSINITADIRVIFYLKEGVMYLIRIGTHS